ncbi:hypothetical protein MTO96_045361 [Rhipicephalus appendiculatus]
MSGPGVHQTLGLQGLRGRCPPPLFAGMLGPGCKPIMRDGLMEVAGDLALTRVQLPRRSWPPRDTSPAIVGEVGVVLWPQVERTGGRFFATLAHSAKALRAGGGDAGS